MLTCPASGYAPQEVPEPPALETAAGRTGPDPLLAQITAAVQGVTTPNVEVLSRSLHVAYGAGASGASANTLTELGEWHGGGAPDWLLKWAAPDATSGVEISPEPDSRPLWCVYLLSWDGSRWKVSRLVAGVEEFTPTVINLGPPVGHALAVVIQEGRRSLEYPAVFQVKAHAASLLWDGQSDDSLYKPLLQGQVNFRQPRDAAAQMIVTGRADPGLLQVDSHGDRGFEVRVVYHWSGQAFVPSKTEYVANPDYTIYRFIAALHLHDYRSAYALTVPAKFLHADSPSLDAFQKFIQDNFPEFLRDEVFEAPNVPAGSPEQHVFVLSKPDAQTIYHPHFSTDGKFLLSGLTKGKAEF